MLVLDLYMHQPAAFQGEHGTGRNVAPYVEMEWGGKAYDLMWRLKSMFDPDDVLNPGVVLNKVCGSRRHIIWMLLDHSHAGKALQRAKWAQRTCKWHVAFPSSSPTVC